MSIDLICVLAAVISHELGHLFTMRLFGVKLKRLRLSFAGAVIEGNRLLPGRLSQTAVLLSGALVNLLGYALGMCLGGEVGELFAACSASLALVNLLPIRSLDGGEALRVIFGDSAVLRAISLVSLVAVFMLSVAAIFLSGNLSLYLLAAQVFMTVYLRG